MNILIVDDQISVVNGLMKGIDWDKLGIDKVLKAFNAFEAKALYNNMPIDILLTDIEMPGESGVSLVQWIREHNFETECIFLTSHNDFEYARDAIKMESFEYALQPCPYDEIQSILSRAIYKIKQKKEWRKYYNYGRTAMQNDTIAKLMFHNSLKLENNAELLEALNLLDVFDGQNTQGYLSLFQIVNSDDHLEQWEDGLLEFALHNVIAEVFGRLGQKIIMAHMDRLIFAVFCYTYNTDALLYEQYIYQMNFLSNIFKNMLNFDVIYRTSGLITPSKLNTEYYAMEQLTVADSAGEDVKDSLNTEKKDSLYTDPVGLVVEYIKGHLDREITRQELADLVYLNIDYLSRIFKKETGSTINDYIIIEKMKFAQIMIHTTILPIGLIATKVGYNNFSYFSKLYKKAIGVSPIEDRNQYRDGN